LARLERYEEAIKSYDEALKIEPDKHEAWYNRGNALARLERYEEAIKSYDEALKIEPEKHEAWNNRGIALAMLERYEEAIKSYDEALKIKPEKHEAWNNRGNGLARLERYEEAIKSYDEALKIKPDDHEAWNNRGAALLDSERSEEAVDSFQKALEHSTVKSDLEMCTLVLVRAYLILSRRNISEGNDAAGLHAFSSAIGHLYEVGAEPIRKDAASAIVDYFRKIVSKMRVGLFKDLIGILSNSGAKDELMLLEPFIIANNFWETGEDSEVLDRLNPEMREIVEEIIRKAGERDRNLNAKPGR
jgi:Flp pilus assembly protein TadD